MAVGGKFLLVDVDHFWWLGRIHRLLNSHFLLHRWGRQWLGI
jgi:hypothetical protein